MIDLLSSIIGFVLGVAITSCIYLRSIHKRLDEITKRIDCDCLDRHDEI